MKFMLGFATGCVFLETRRAFQFYRFVQENPDTDDAIEAKERWARIRVSIEELKDEIKTSYRRIKTEDDFKKIIEDNDLE